MSANDRQHDVVHHVRHFAVWTAQQGRMDVDHGGRGTRETSPATEFGVGDADCPLRFCHIGTKRSVLWPSNYAKIRFRPGLTMLPRPSSRLGRGHPSPYPTPLCTDPPSVLVMRPPEFQPDLRLCKHGARNCKLLMIERVNN